jgi:hypothetical protein
VCGREEYPPAVRSAQAPWSARPQAEVSWADRCAVGCRPEARLQAACQRGVSLSEQPSAAWDARVPQAVAAEAEVACASAQQPAVAAVPLALPVAEAAERAAAGAEVAVPHAAGAAAVEVPHAAAAAAAAAAAVEEPASLRVGAEEEVVVVAAARASQPVAEEVPALPGRQPVARPSAAGPSYPSRLRSAPVQRPAVTRLAVHAPLRSQIAPLTARWWPAARGEVWSW